MGRQFAVLQDGLLSHYKIMPAAVAREIWKWISEGVAMEHIVVWLRSRTVPTVTGAEYKVTTWKHGLLSIFISTCVLHLSVFQTNPKI